MSTRPAWLHGRRRILGLAAVAVVIAMLITIAGVLGGDRTSPEAAADGNGALLGTVPLAAGTRVVIFGDSWTVARGIAPAGHGYAFLIGDALDWVTTIDGASGTGYLNPGIEGRGTYRERLAERSVDVDVDLVVLQGGLNDRSQDMDALPEAVRETIAVVQRTYPNARVVVFGPAPNKLPESKALRQVDYTLASVAAATGVHYISPVKEHWISDDNYAAMIDPQLNYHPSIAGHAYLAEHLAEALRALQ